MGYRELIEALCKEGEEKIRAIRQEAEAEAERIRAETARRVDELREQYSQMQSSAIEEETGEIISEAEKKASVIMLFSGKELSDRLYKLALSSLHILRNGNYKDVFGALVNELPDHKWDIVKVNPEDDGIAREYFPESEIIPDTSITGGLEVMTGDERIKVANTFEKRLERGWAEILPELIRDIYESSSKTTR